MDNLKYVTKLAEALHGFALQLETNADVFTKEDGTITTSFKPLHFPNIVLSTTPLDKFSPQELLKVNNAFLRHLIELLNDQLNNSEFCMTNRNDLELLEGHTGQLASFNYNKQKVTHLANEINSTTPTAVYVQTEEQTPTNSNPLANCTPEDFDSTKKVLKAALDSNPDLHTSNTLQNFIKNELPKLEKQTEALLKEELINQTKNRFNLLLERASSSTDVSVIYKALDLIDSLAYPNFEWDTTQVNLLYKKLND